MGSVQRCVYLVSAQVGVKLDGGQSEVEEEDGVAIVLNSQLEVDMLEFYPQIRGLFTLAQRESRFNLASSLTLREGPINCEASLDLLVSRPNPPRPRHAENFFLFLPILPTFCLIRLLYHPSEQSIILHKLSSKPIKRFGRLAPSLLTAGAAARSLAHLLSFDSIKCCTVVGFGGRFWNAGMTTRFHFHFCLQDMFRFNENITITTPFSGLLQLEIGLNPAILVDKGVYNFALDAKWRSYSDWHTVRSRTYVS